MAKGSFLTLPDANTLSDLPERARKPAANGHSQRYLDLRLLLASHPKLTVFSGHLRRPIAFPAFWEWGVI